MWVSQREGPQLGRQQDKRLNLYSRFIVSGMKPGINRRSLRTARPSLGWAHPWHFDTHFSLRINPRPATKKS